MKYAITVSNNFYFIIPLASTIFLTWFRIRNYTAWLLFSDFNFEKYVEQYCYDYRCTGTEKILLK